MCSGGEKSKNPPNFFGPSNTNVFCLTTDTAEICTTHTLSTSGYYKNIRAILKCFLWPQCSPKVLQIFFDPKFCKFFLTKSFSNFFTFEHFRRAYFSTFSIFSPTYPHFRGST